MSNSPWYRATVNTASKQYRAAVDTASKQYHATANVARKHSRVSAFAAAAAAAGVLGAAGFAAGAAPWSQAIDNVSTTVHGGSQSSSSSHLGSDLFAVITGTTNTGKPATSQLDDVNSVDKAGTTTSAAGTQKPAAQHAATVAAGALKHQPAKAQPAKAEPVKAQPAKAQPVKAQPAKAKPVKHAAPAAPAKPYVIYDSVTPGSIPTGQPAAVYVDGAYATSWGQMGGHKSVLWIDTNGSDPHANVLDVEPGDATPAGAAQWVQQRLSWHSDATAVVYTMMSDWQQVKDDMATIPSWMQSHVRYWIADPTGYPHVVPGSSATQWYWGSNYDETTATPDFQQ